MKVIAQTKELVATHPSSQQSDCQPCLLAKLNYQPGRVAVLTRKQLSPAATCTAFRCAYGKSTRATKPPARQALVSPAASPLTRFLLPAAQVVFSGGGCPRTELGMCAEAGPARLTGAAPSAAARHTQCRAVPEQISPESRQGSLLPYTQHLAGLLPSI